jgi:hypothetical protein
MALEFDQPKENELFIKYIYDDMDRLILRNVYEFNVGAKAPIKNTPNKPKKLLYQDVYRYGNNQDPNNVKRIYQPIITPPTGTRNGSNISFTSTFTCRSNVETYGFIWRSSLDQLMMEAQYPSIGDFRNTNPGLLNDGRLVLQNISGLGQVTHTLTTASTLYIKAFCMIETGILFSKTLTL